jgi:aldose 1-epimerase
MAEVVSLRAGHAEADLDPAAGGRIARLRVDGLDLVLSDGPGPLAWGCYPMAPWAGRLRGGILRWRGDKVPFPIDLMPPHAIHGTLLETPWAVTEAGPDKATLAADLGPPWPFGGRVIQRVRLEEDALRASLEVQAADRPMPAIVGWHPWFPRRLRNSSGATVGGPVEVDLRAGGMLRRGADGLPTGVVVPVPPGPWDDCFVDVAPDPGVRWPGALELKVSSDLPFWVVFTEAETGVCIEPQSGPPDGLNTGQCAVVEPGRPLLAEMTLRWRRLG